MLLPALHIDDLRDRPTTIRVGDATFGYGFNGDAERADVEQAVLTIEKWVGDTGNLQRKPILNTYLPQSFWRRNQLVDLPYPQGDSLEGDGLLIFSLALYGKIGVPVSKATYTATFGITTDPILQRVLIKRNGAFETLPDSFSVQALFEYKEEATADVLTDWRIETIATGLPVCEGVFSVSGQFLSPLDSTTTATLSLLAKSSQAVLFLSRSRRRLNRLGERLAIHCHLPLGEYVADGLVWLRMYERLTELSLVADADRSPYRTSYLLSDFHQTLDPLWHRHG